MRISALFLCLACLAPAAAQDIRQDTLAPPAREAPLFMSDEPLRLTLSFDVREVTNDRSEKPPWYPATITHTAADGTETTRELGVRTRGFYRLNYLDCDIPPLRLNIRKREAGGTIFEGQDKLKLVTHCENGSERFQQYVFQEYHIYRAYQLLTDHSFRTRLVHITYHDVTGRRDDVTSYGFLIEEDKRMAERIGGEIVKRTRIHPEATDREQAALMSLFHYMVGNTDYTVSTLHNVRLVYQAAVADSLNKAGAFDTGESALISVPYDFDWSGLINTRYATPDPQLRLSSVRERRYMGFCRTVEEMQPVVARFRAKEDDLYALFRQSEYLEPRVAERSVEYLEGFFEQIETERGVRRALRNCQGG